MYGLLLTCVTLDNLTYCILQELELQQVMGFTVHNEQDCPLLTLTKTLCVVPSSAVITHISVIHQCTSTCNITTQPFTIEREREQLSNEKLVHYQDFSNDNYVLFECLLYESVIFISCSLAILTAACQHIIVSANLHDCIITIKTKH